ncbi:MAG TPA: Wzz/FepE/Etk N-terminal domain-containing protein [Nocardioidaceae bacterium]|nr:Wzz/FepE/Etk N-terminal domain-containing protein [Nocardioidaceae bacterium]
MSEQTVDLRSSLSILRRHRKALALVAVLGMGAGVAFGLLRPPMYASTAKMLLPPAQNITGQPVTRDVQTDVEIAGSEAVLGPAGRSLDPPASVRALSRRVEASAPTTQVLEIRARAGEPRRAEDIAQAVAEAMVAYVTDTATTMTTTQQASMDRRKSDLEASLDAVNDEIAKSRTRLRESNATGAGSEAEATALSDLTAQQASLVLQLDALEEQAISMQPSAAAGIIEDASPARRAGVVTWFAISAVLGAAVALALAALVLVLARRRDRKLSYRDEIADAVGSPVIASVRAHVPRTVAGWATLLEDYSPGTVDAWALRQALRQLVFDDPARGHRRAEQGSAKLAHPPSVTVLSLADDLRGLAVGAQLASYAASVGIRTRLVAGPGHESAAALWAACNVLSDREEVRRNLTIDAEREGTSEGEMTVVLAVLDRSEPELLPAAATSVTVLALASGAATAEDLARAAVTADDAGSRIDGVVVADPDNLDRTTGRLLQHERAQQVPLPTRVPGVAPLRASGRKNVSNLSRRPR